MDNTTTKNYLVGLFTDEHKVLKSVRLLRESGYKIHDVFTPYVVHGLDDAMGVKRSRLGIVTFLAGLTGLLISLSFQFWTSVSNWRVNVGGKPDNSTLAFLPVSFEVTILIGGLTTVLAFFIRSRLYPGAKTNLFHDNITHDRFAVVLEIQDASVSPEKAKSIFVHSGAVEIQEKSADL